MNSPMPEGSFLYCDVSLPVPLDRAFTYSLPETLRHRVKPGCRLIVPFGVRKMTGVALRCHDEPPSVETRQALRLIDSEPVLDEEMLRLAHWIAITIARRWAKYYAACCRSRATFTQAKFTS